MVKHNDAIKISSWDYTGEFRVVAKLVGYYALAKLNDPIIEDVSSKTSQAIKQNKNHNPKKILWVPVETLDGLITSEESLIINIQAPKLSFDAGMSPAMKKIFEKRKQVMAGFLQYQNLHARLKIDGKIGGLVKEAVLKGGISRQNVYKLFNLLCEHGFTEHALIPGYYNSGAPGTPRYYQEGKKKVGRKTIEQKIQKANGEDDTPTQPGLSEAWKRRILAADKEFELPKPSMRKRYKRLAQHEFIKDYIFVDNQRRGVAQLGSYPNFRQVQRVLLKDGDELQQEKNKTTPHNFELNHRGLEGYAIEGVAGPGHTFAVDSTVGDVYLRSALNPRWIVGRPVVYIISDVWSGAVVGFYVCLTGPSWEMAKIGLFCSLAATDLIGELRGVLPSVWLNPMPSLPIIWLADRGESHSKLATITGTKIGMVDLAVIPPYRGDYKGGIETMFNISKNEQFKFVPGAFDARRVEMELRKFDMSEATLTVRQYTRLLHHQFYAYNRTCQPHYKIDAMMKAHSIRPTPAARWEWGYKMKIGTHIARSKDELIMALLPKTTGHTHKDGLHIHGLHYTNRTPEELVKASIARNKGSFATEAYYFPGYIGKAWVPNKTGSGLDEIRLDDHAKASKDLTLDEHDDVNAFYNAGIHERAHEDILITSGSIESQLEIIREAEREKKETVFNVNDWIPTPTNARSMEKASDMFRQSPNTPSILPDADLLDEVDEEYTSIMDKILIDGLEGGSKE